MNSNRPSPLRFKFRQGLRIAAFCLAFMDAPAAFAEELVIVAHPETRIAAMSLADLTQIYLGKKTVQDDGTRIIPLDLAPEKNLFYEKVLNKSMSLMTRYWTGAIFSGKATPPREFKNTQSLLDYLRETPGGLAYLPAGIDFGKLKIVSITP